MGNKNLDLLNWYLKENFRIMRQNIIQKQKQNIIPVDLTKNQLTQPESIALKAHKSLVAQVSQDLP